jgi:hypothetical protein
MEPLYNNYGYNSGYYAGQMSENVSAMSEMSIGGKMSETDRSSSPDTEAVPSERALPDSGIQSAAETETVSETAQSNAEIAQSMGLIPIDVSYAYANSCLFCYYGMSHPTADDIPALMDGSWYNQMAPGHFNTIISYLQPQP